MADILITRRVEFVLKGSNAAGVAIARLEQLSNSGNPDVAARASAFLMIERNEQDDLNVLRAFIENQPAAALKPISDENLAMLEALEKSIDTRIQNDRLINASLAGATEILRSAEAIDQILKQAS